MYITSGSITSGDLGEGVVVSSSIASGQIGGTHYGSGSVQSAAYASGSVSTFKIAAGAITSSLIASGQVGQSIIASGGVTSAHIASGQIGLSHLASGLSSLPLLADTITTEEAISGGRCVNISQSGYARVAMAGVSGRMPAHGICPTNVASGTVLSPFSGNALIIAGTWQPTSGLLPNPAVFGQYLFVGMSGNVTQTYASGMLVQRVGKMLKSGVASISVTDNMVTSGQNPTFYGTF
jgi:hypothetical protein